MGDHLQNPGRREILASALARLASAAQGLPHVSAARRGLLDAPDGAWRPYACALLATELGAGN